MRGIPKMQFFKDKMCLACKKGKKTKSSFKPKLCSSIITPLHLLHMDLFGPVSIKSKARKKYTLVIVDNFQDLPG